MFVQAAEASTFFVQDLLYLCCFPVQQVPGIQTNLFCQEQAGPLKQNDWGPRIQTKIKLVSTALPSINFASLIIEVIDPQYLYSSYYLPY